MILPSKMGMAADVGRLNPDLLSKDVDAVFNDAVLLKDEWRKGVLTPNSSYWRLSDARTRRRRVFWSILSQVVRWT